LQPKFSLPGPPRPGGLQGPASQLPRRPLHEWPPVKSAPVSIRGSVITVWVRVRFTLRIYKLLEKVPKTRIYHVIKTGQWRSDPLRILSCPNVNVAYSE